MSAQRRIFHRRGESCAVDAFLHGDRIELHGEDGTTAYAFHRSGEDRVVLLTGDGPVPARFFRDGSVLWIHAAGRTFRLDVELPGRTRARGGASGANEVTAPMTGTVRKVLVSPGDSVELGDPVVVLEAMKMEHVLKAPRAGVIASIACAAGEQAEAQSILVRIEEA